MTSKKPCPIFTISTTSYHSTLPGKCLCFQLIHLFTSTKKVVAFVVAVIYTACGKDDLEETKFRAVIRKKNVYALRKEMIKALRLQILLEKIRCYYSVRLPHYSVRFTSGYYYSVRFTTELFIPHPSRATHLLLQL